MKRFFYNDIEQGSDRWFSIRLGRLTGSTSQPLLVGDGLGAGAITLAYKKAAEIITGEDPYKFGNKFTERGNELEPLAIEAYEEATFNSVIPCGFITLGDHIGCSVDGLVDDDGIIEVKCPEQSEFLRLLDSCSGGIDNLDVSKDYERQIQFNLWVSDRKWCDHVYWHPKFKKSIIIKRYNRDESVIEKFKSKSELFIAEVQRILKADTK